MFSTMLKELIILKSSVFNNNLLRTGNFSLSKFCLSDCYLFSTAIDKDKCIPLDEISNLTSCSLNCTEEKKQQIIDEINYLRSVGKMIPKFIKLSDIVDLTEFTSRSQRRSYLGYLFKKERIKINEVEKKRMKKLEQENKTTERVSSPDQMKYGIAKNTLLLRNWKRNVMKFYDKRLANSVLFGQKLVIDLSYDEHMWKKERKACASQLKLLYYFNRQNRNPYDLYFCNASPNSRCVQYLQEDMPKIDESFVTLSEKSYLDFFPRDSLVYLSPHAPEMLETYDHNAVYIIGGFVDTVKRDHLSSFKAKEEGIKSYSLPLEEYVLWGNGCKSLSINQVFQIMHTVRNTGDWKETFKQHIPTRKLRRVEANSVEKQELSDKLFVMAN